jgi:sulfite oxidase
MNVLFSPQILEKTKMEEKVGVLPIYRRVDVQKHRRIQDRVWVSYQDSVYDITDFLKVHPGGTEKLMMAAGGPIESFWEMYPFHKKDTVKNLLVPYKIGHLHKDDIV